MKLLFLALLIVLVSGCSHNRYVTASELNTLLKVSPSQVLIIDTRSAWEYHKAHIPSAIHIPFWKAPFINQHTLDCSDKKIVIHCAHGPRAGIGKWFLENESCHDIHFLKGHFKAWQKANLPVVRKSQEQLNLSTAE